MYKKPFVARRENIIANMVGMYFGNKAHNTNIFIPENPKQWRYFRLLLSKTAAIKSVPKATFR